MTSTTQSDQRDVSTSDDAEDDLENASPDPGTRRRRLRLALALGGVAALAATAIVVVALGETQAPPPLVITEAGAVVEGRTLSTPVVIRANGVTIRNVEISAAAETVISIDPDTRGAVIEDTVIRCRSTRANGIAPGYYSAVRVRTFGCAHPFVRDEENPAEIVDSSSDGEAWSSAQPSAPAASAAAASSGPPSPSATPSSSATPSTTRTTQAARQPTPSVPSSWPGPGTTGVPAGTQLKSSGSLSITTAGAVISGLNINGCVDVKASNVTIKRSKINCSSGLYAVRTYDNVRSLVVEDVEIDGGGQTSAAVCCGNYTLRRVNVHSTIDGPRLGSNTTIVDSWVHHLSRVSGSHNDALQTTGASNIVVRHNRLEPYNPSTGDPFNAALMIGSTTGPEVRNLSFEDNFCNGGNYTIGIRDDLNASGIVIRRNTFGTNYRYGVVARWNHPGISWETSSNVFLSSGKPVATG